MSDWYGPDDELLGEWVPCSNAEYEAIKFDRSIDWQPFASRTDVGRRQDDGSYVDRLIYTEWGRRGDAAPLVACEDRTDSWGGNEHRHYRFVAAAPVGGGLGV